MIINEGFALLERLRSGRKFTEQDYVSLAEFWEWIDDVEKAHQEILESNLLLLVEQNADDLYSLLSAKIRDLREVINRQEQIINNKVQQLHQEHGSNEHYDTLKSLQLLQDNWRLQSLLDEEANVKRAIFSCIPYLKKIKVAQSATLDIAKAKNVPIMSLLPAQKSRQIGDKIMLTSPFRQETLPSFCVYVRANTWYDFGAAEGGDVITLYQKLYNCDFKEAIHALTK